MPCSRRERRQQITNDGYTVWFIPANAGEHNCKYRLASERINVNDTSTNRGQNDVARYGDLARADGIHPAPGG